MSKKITVTIGIPAYNEEKNIINMLKSVIKQRQNGFSLEKILVISDGSNDKTEEYVKKLSKKYPVIKLVADRKRLGKAQRLNQLYKLNESDFLGTFDADIVLERDFELELMMQTIVNNKEVNVVAANQLPVPSKSWMGKFSTVSFYMFYEAAKKYRDGNNIHCIQGSSSLLKRDFAKSFRYPADVVCDQGYLYFKATQDNPLGFRFVKSTIVLFNPISTFKEWRVLGYRTIFADKENITKYFGKEALQSYIIPRKIIAQTLLESFVKYPFETVGAIIMNIYIRRFPIRKKAAIKKRGVWDILTSSKVVIS